jgi:DNA-binding response OmpR family regulator
MHTEDPQQAPIILVVDDEEDIRYLLQISLEQEGFRVVTASSGREALHFIADNRPDLVVLDVMMPEIDGFEVLRRLKENEATCHIPVVMLTAKDSTSAVVSGLEIGADFYWTKPFKVPDLARTVRLILEHEILDPQEDRADGATGTTSRQSGTALPL